MAVTAVLIGAGGRGQYSYAPYALENSNKFKFVGVAEPKDFLRNEFKEKYKVDESNCFETWQELLAKPKFADSVMICTQDRMHLEPTIKAIEQGYKYILLEKPISPDLSECIKIRDAAIKNGVNIQVCHSLRYSPIIRAIKNVLASGKIGKIVNITHNEDVGYGHYAHSFVRGDWANSDESAPMILAKSCHDMDLLLYLTEKECVSVSSYGGLFEFKRENAPEGSAERCTDGCVAKNDCPFYAPRLYQGSPFSYLACEKEGFTDLNEALVKGRYGRCVYKCDNNVVDHQTVNIEFTDGVIAAFTMSAFNRGGRFIRIMGTRGELISNIDKNEIEVYDFITRNTTTEKIHCGTSMHMGADEVIMEDFVDVVKNDTSGCTNIAVSVESHKMSLAAEKSRVEGGRKVELKEMEI